MIKKIGIKTYIWKMYTCVENNPNKAEKETKEKPKNETRKIKNKIRNPEKNQCKKKKKQKKKRKPNKINKIRIIILTN